MSKSKILFQLTGSIACFKACQLISKLVQNGFEVQTVASKSALRFVGPATLEGLTGRPVYSDLWESGRMMDHISLNRWADIVIVAPATANYINKIAMGAGDDLLSTLFLAHDFQKPFMIVPAMNSAMYLHPLTQKSIHSLGQIGIQFMKTQEGQLACGEMGEGRMQEPDKIFDFIQSCLPQKKFLGKILITSGGTSEALDDVRVLSNRSTGKTAAALADYFTKQNYRVTYIHSQHAVRPRSRADCIEFQTSADLEEILKQQLSKSFDAIFHAAAVSDFLPEKALGKLDSEPETLVLKLQKNKKLIQSISTWSANPELKIVGFKLTATELESEKQRAVAKLFATSQVDLVVQNDVNEMNSQQHPFRVYADDHSYKKVSNYFELAQSLEQILWPKTRKGELDL